MAVTRKQSISVTMTTVKLACRWVMIALRLFLHISSLNQSCHVGLELALNNLLTIIGWGWAKYRDLSGFWRAAEANNGCARHWQIAIFAITEFNNCFIIRLPSLFFNEYLWKRVRAHCLSCMSYDRSNGFLPVLLIYATKHSWTTLRMSRSLFVGSYLQVTWWTLGFHDLVGKTVSLIFFSWLSP